MPYNNYYMRRTGSRAISEMILRNAYDKDFGIQYYLVVEGESDEHFFENILDCENCKVRNVKGKEEVKDFIKERNAERKKGYLGIVDADFEHITKYETKIDNVILTDYHDIEMLILNSHPNMRRIYSEMTDNIIIRNYEKKHHTSYIQATIDAAYEIGMLRLVLSKGKYKYELDMKNLPYEDIVNDSFNVNIDMLIKRMLRNKKFTLYEIQQLINDEKANKHDKYHACCGHDVTSILANSFMLKEYGGLGYGHKKSVKKEEIEELLRVIYDYSNFLRTTMYKKIVEWEKNNKIEILDRKVFGIA